MCWTDPHLSRQPANEPLLSGKAVEVASSCQATCERPCDRCVLIQCKCKVEYTSVRCWTITSTSMQSLAMCICKLLAQLILVDPRVCLSQLIVGTSLVMQDICKSCQVVLGCKLLSTGIPDETRLPDLSPIAPVPPLLAPAALSGPQLAAHELYLDCQQIASPHHESVSSVMMYQHSCSQTVRLAIAGQGGTHSYISSAMQHPRPKHGLPKLPNQQQNKPGYQ